MPDSSTTDPRARIALSVSSTARARLETLAAWASALPPSPPPVTLEDFDAAAERGAAAGEWLSREPLARLAPVVTERRFGAIAGLEVRPRDHRDDGSALVYIHGGGFVGGSARANLLTAALAAATTGRRVFSLDYTLAPRGTWRTILEELVSAWSAITREVPAHALGLLGDSAGGCLALALSLLLRDRGLPAPVALIALSPVTDLGWRGDTCVTLAAVDYLDMSSLHGAIRAYAPDADLNDPLVSPVYGDFALGFPPVLLQVGTRELLLSDSVRLHRALRAAGQASRLEVYEGMPHVFQPLLADTPEGEAAWAEMAAFWAEHLTS
jgi:acetyl esterase/lipase